MIFNKPCRILISITIATLSLSFNTQAALVTYTFTAGASGSSERVQEYIYTPGRGTVLTYDNGCNDCISGDMVFSINTDTYSDFSVNNDGITENRSWVVPPQSAWLSSTSTLSGVTSSTVTSNGTAFSWHIATNGLVAGIPAHFHLEDAASYFVVDAGTPYTANPDGTYTRIYDVSQNDVALFGGGYTFSKIDDKELVTAFSPLQGGAMHQETTYTTFLYDSDFNLVSANGFTISIDAPFSGVSVSISDPVPEPETYALMLAGLGLVGFAARRRKLD